MASPGNLSEDRKKVSEIIKHINLDSGQREGFVAEIVSWETHTRPAAGEYAQAVINDQFPDDIDIFIGMMGTYFGTPTKEWGSGTEEEFQIAFSNWEKTKAPEIMFYFSDAMSSLSQIDTDQLSKRNAFRKRIANLGVYYFSYTDIVEFQFDLIRHISSAIRKVLGGKEVGKSAVAIPQESAISLKNYTELLAQDPLLNAVSIIDSATDYMNSYTRTLNDLAQDVGKLARKLTRETKNIESAKQTKNQQKAKKSLGAVYSEMNRYSKKLAINIPKLSTEFSESIMSILRVDRLVNDNDLADVLPLTDIVSDVAQARTALSSLVNIIRETEASFADWPEEIVDMHIQKQIVIALHQDLISSLVKSIELLGRLLDEVGR